MPRETHDTFSTLQLRALLGALPQLNVDPDKILGHMGVARSRIDDPGARLPVALEQVFWDAVISATGDAAIALRFADLFPAGAFGSFEYLLRNSATLAEALAAANKFMRLLDDAALIELHVERDAASVRFLRDSAHQTCGPSMECVFAVLVANARHRRPGRNHLRRVRFAHALRVDIERYRNWFGCHVEFGAGANELTFGAELLRDSWQADPALRLLLEDYAELQLAQLPAVDPLLHAVQKRVLSQLHEGAPSLSSIARSLHMSERTLRRKLKTAGTGYHELLDALRSQLARDYMARPTADANTVAQRVGFREPSMFYRAFKRWTGMTPAQFQKRRASAK